MSRVIPAILTQNEQEFRKQVSLAVAFAPSIQIDVLDGTLFPEKSWNNAKAAAAMNLSIPFEAHLMVNNPELKVPAWIRAGANRIIVHAEAKGSILNAFEQIRLAGKLVGVALDPETDLAILKNIAHLIDHVQIMGVIPGAQGRAFDPEAINRARAVKRIFPQLTVSVDGGITTNNHIAKKLAEAGVDDLVVGSAIWKSNDVGDAYRNLVTDATI